MVKQSFGGESSRRTIPDAGRRILEELKRIGSGAMTKAEISGYVNSMDIYMLGPVI